MEEKKNHIFFDVLLLTPFYIAFLLTTEKENFISLKCSRGDEKKNYYFNLFSLISFFFFFLLLFTSSYEPRQKIQKTTHSVMEDLLFATHIIIFFLIAFFLLSLFAKIHFTYPSKNL
jgi:hypothetical protein